MKKIIFLVLTTLFISSTSYSQDYFTIKGSVTDKQTGETIPSAHIYTNKSLGTISNTDGEFIFKIPKSNNSDSLFVSFIGYTTYSTLLDSLKDNSNISIELTSNSVQLSEVVITPLKGSELIEQAISRIPINYSNKPLMFTGFYKEVTHIIPLQVNDSPDLRKKDISEAVCEIYYSSYPLKKNDKIEKDYIKLLAWRKVNEIEDTLHKSFTGSGPNGIIKKDIVKHIDNSFLRKKERKNYNFELRGTTVYENRMIYIVDFDQKDNITKSLLKGSIYLDTESLAFIHIDYSLSPKGLKHNSEKKILFIGAKFNNNYTKIDYRKNEDNKWSLYYSQYQFDFRFSIYKNFMTRSLFEKENKNKEEILFNIKGKQEFIVNETKINDVIKISKDELFKQNTKLTEEINSDNADIWGKYNYIKPTGID